MKQSVLAELQRLAQLNNGVLLPKVVVDAARPAASPLHSQFEWDDTEAAEAYRIWQARQLIRVTVRLLDVSDADSATRVFVSLTTDRKDGGYRVLADVLSDESQRDQLLQDARREMKRFKAKYATLVELAEVFSAIDHATKVA